MRLWRYEIEQRLCRRCGSCQQACAKQAVRELSDKRVAIDQDRCARCGDCQAACKLRAVVKHRGLFP